MSPFIPSEEALDDHYGRKGASRHKPSQPKKHVIIQASRPVVKQKRRFGFVKGMALQEVLANGN